MAAIRALGWPEERAHAWLWVLEFPLFVEEEGALSPGHHPFVLPHADDLDKIESDPTSARSHAYDLVYNGAEFGSGSIRIHDAGLQRRVLRRLGMKDDEIERKFGFLLEALASGAPPHGGIALGVDRIMKTFLGLASLRDVIAFPKTTAARALFEGAPAPVGSAELAGLGLALGSPKPR
jgi:aspartyl-tRNA synthetase